MIESVGRFETRLETTRFPEPVWCARAAGFNPPYDGQSGLKAERAQGETIRFKNRRHPMKAGLV